MPVIRFSTNVPVELRLRYLEGRAVESQFGGMQHMFTAEEGLFYVSETVGTILAEQFRRLGVRTGETVKITKAEVSKGSGRKGIEWMVARAGLVPGEQPDGTFAVAKADPSELEQKLAESIRIIEVRKQATHTDQVRKQAIPAIPTDQPRWAQVLSAQTKHVLDVYAELVAYATAKHGNVVRQDDIRTMMTTVFINLSKNSGGNTNAA